MDDCTTHGCCADAICHLAQAAKCCIDQCAMHATEKNQKGCDDCASALADTISAIQKHLDCMKGCCATAVAQVKKP